jgi:preprotein translocase subunit YajC
MLDFFLSAAFAQQAPAGAPAANPILQFAPLIVLAVLFYFMLIRPQMKRNKEHRQMLSSIAKGDEVLTSGGIAGKVTAIGEAYLTIEVADNVAIKVSKPAVTSVLPKGTLKAL